MRNIKLYSTVLSTIFVAGLANSEPQVTGKITHEAASYTRSGANIGTTTSHDKDTFKSETSARVYIDGDLEDERGSTYHVELQGYHNGEAVSGLDGSESYTQRDPLRELYVDTTVNDWNLRLGKQQVVWGTADGMKLLDIINPTDYTEMVQNQMEDSRIPVWMINAEKSLDDGGSFQFVASNPRENIFTGLDRNISTARRANASWSAGGTDTTRSAGYMEGSPFVLKGVNSITGKTDGFLNIVPDLASVAGGFYGTFGTKKDSNCTAYNDTKNLVGACRDGNDNAFDATDMGRLSTFTHFSVGTFAQMAEGTGAAGTVTGNFYQFPTLQGIGDGSAILDAFTSPAYDTNLNNATSASTWGSTKDSTFEYMANASFATFDAFVDAGSQYKYDMPDDTDLDYAMRYNNTTEDGTNYSLVASYNYDKNPIIDLDWRGTSGELLTTSSSQATYGGLTAVTLTLADSSGNRYGGYVGGGTSAGAATLRFTQRLQRTKNLGGAFSHNIDTEALGPVVIRGEALYQKDVKTPVMDLGALSVGDLPAALQMVEGDRFKYVLGVDITALTNMMVSLQFIQDRDLDYIDETKTYVLSSGSNSNFSGKRFRTDYSTMSLKNGFNKAEKNKEFVSVYLSKPFGESGQHRWNNITMLEENGGRWNRLDVEYTIDDNTIATAEFNKYWGDANTQFGQLKNSSNVQLGVKYSF